MSEQNDDIFLTIGFYAFYSLIACYCDYSTEAELLCPSCRLKVEKKGTNKRTLSHYRYYTTTHSFLLLSSYSQGSQ